MENYQYMQEGETDLKKCIGVLIKRKRFVLIVFILAVVMAFLTSLWIPKDYEVTSTIQLGSIGRFLINKEEAKEIILNQNSLLSIIKELNLKDGVENIKRNITIRDIVKTNLLKIDVVYPDINMAFKINEALISPFIAQGQIILQERLILAEERLKELNKKIKNIEQDIDMKKAWVSGETDAKRKALLQSGLLIYRNNLFEFMEQRKELKFLLVNAKDFIIFDQPIESKNPIKRKWQKVLFVGQITLMLGILLVFLMEFWEKN